MILLYVLTLICYACADYVCICNYNAQKHVFATTSEASQILGTLTSGDCYEVIQTSLLSNTWSSIAFSQQVGYIKKNVNTDILTCSGHPSTNNTVTTTIPSSSWLTTEASTDVAVNVSTNLKSTQTPVAHSVTTPSSSKPYVSMHEPAPTQFTNSSHTCSQEAQRAAVMENGVLIINHVEGKCYVFVQSHHSWSTSENTCNNSGGHLVTVRNENENNVLLEYVKEYGHNTWIGLSDIHSEEEFTWTSGENTSYTNWLSGRKDFLFHNFEDCVSMVPSTGEWEDMSCSKSYAYICEYDSVPYANGISGLVPSMNTHGNTHLCPTSSILAARRDSNIILGQYGQLCYELHNGSRVSWTSAESTCKQHGGHLVHIGNTDEQNFIEAFLTHYSSQLATWIGLYDRNNESNFEWTSGEPVTYTNWIPSHNETSHDSKDCVVLLPNQTGQWDEVYCGSHGFFFNSHTERHQTLCQYKIVTHTSSILIG